MKPALPVLATAFVAFAVAPAQAATLQANKLCYREADARDPVVFGGGPFSPSGSVNVTRDGLPIGTLSATPRGFISGVITRAPIIDPARERPFTIVATDRMNPALTGSISRLVSQLDVNVRPTGGRPATRRRISARGFTGGGSLYAHVVRGRRVRNVRIGRLAGPCGTLTRRKRVFGKRTRNGVYRGQIDASRRYSATTYPSQTFRVRIFTVLRPRSSAASASQRWAGID